jgi:hypothetical protein
MLQRLENNFLRNTSKIGKGFGVIKIISRGNNEIIKAIRELLSNLSEILFYIMTVSMYRCRK